MSRTTELAPQPELPPLSPEQKDKIFSSWNQELVKCRLSTLEQEKNRLQDLLNESQQRAAGSGGAEGEKKSATSAAAGGGGGGGAEKIPLLERECHETLLRIAKSNEEAFKAGRPHKNSQTYWLDHKPVYSLAHEELPLLLEFRGADPKIIAFLEDMGVTGLDFSDISFEETEEETFSEAYCKEYGMEKEKTKEFMKLWHDLCDRWKHGARL